MGKTAFLILFAFIKVIFPQWSNDPNVNLTVGYGLNGQLASDSKGGCYISYETETVNYPFKTDIVRLDKYGNQLWKTRITGDYPEQWYARIIDDEKGGVIISYTDDSVAGMYDVYSMYKLQRIDNQGNFLWGEKGKRINLKENDGGVAAIAPDGDGGCAVVWIDNYYTREYRINRISSGGDFMWGDSGIVCGTNMYGWDPLLKRLTGGNYVFAVGNLIKFFDPQGNVIYQNSMENIGSLLSDIYGNLFMTVAKQEGPSTINTFVMYKDSLGNNIWSEPKFITDSLTSKFNCLYLNNYLYLLWTGKRNGIQYIPMFQILRRDGTKVFPDNIALSNARTYSLALGLIPSDNSTVIIVRADSSAPVKGFYAQKFDTLGNNVWGKNVLVSIFSGLSTVSDCNGGIIHLTSNTNEFTIKAQQVNAYGILGDVITSVKENNELIR